VPLALVYFTYGAVGLIDVSRDLWVKETLTLTPSELAGIGIWLTLPWTVKMVFGELVDCVPIFGSQRRVYILIGAALTAIGLLILAGAAGRWFTGRWLTARADYLYVTGTLLIVLGTVVQDVVADAMSTEVVSRIDVDGKPVPEDHLRSELGMVQVIGRLAFSFGVLAVAGPSGRVAAWFSPETVFLLALCIPVISVIAALRIKTESMERRSIDWRILGGGIAFGAVVISLGLGRVPFAQEIVFVISISVICIMLVFVTRELAPATRRTILFTTIIIFAFRATPSAGDGYFWWTLDVMHFDAQFYGVLRRTGALLGFVAMLLLAKQLTEYSAAKTLFWLAVAGTLLSLPSIGLYYGLHEWTERIFGFGARSIAIVDAAAASPLAQLSVIPLLTLVAFYAPVGHRATWFALMASLMNLATVAGQLQTKYLNHVFVVERGQYGELGPLLIAATIIGFVLPIFAILVLGRRI
jgi:hypothetical protein